MYHQLLKTIDITGKHPSSHIYLLLNTYETNPVPVLLRISAVIVKGWHLYYSSWLRIVELCFSGHGPQVVVPLPVLDDGGITCTPPAKTILLAYPMPAHRRQQTRRLLSWVTSLRPQAPVCRARP